MASSPVFHRRHSALLTSSKKSSGCCGCFKDGHHRVAPTEGGHPEFEIVNVRQNRYLRVRHLNAMQRSKSFDNQMLLMKHQNSSSDHASSSVIKKPGSNSSLKDMCQDNDKSKAENKKTELALSMLEDANANHNHGILDIPSGIQTRSTTASSVTFVLKSNDTAVAAASSNSSRNNTTHSSATDNIPLFFIHGVGGSSDVWQAQIDYFTDKGYEIIAPDIIGHGFSSAPRDPAAYHFKEIVEDLLSLFDMYCKKKNFVIGHSYG